MSIYRGNYKEVERRRRDILAYKKTDYWYMSQQKEETSRAPGPKLQFENMIKEFIGKNPSNKQIMARQVKELIKSFIEGHEVYNSKKGVEAVTLWAKEILAKLNFEVIAEGNPIESKEQKSLEL